jgi:hypothetical protein
VRVLEKLADREMTHVVPGHGAVGTAAALRGNAAYLADMLRQVREAAGRGVPAEKLQVDLKRHDPWGQDEKRNLDSARYMLAWLARKK